MAFLTEDIGRALLQPDAVLQSVSAADTRLLSILTGTVVGSKYPCLVVKILETDAFVLTPYWTDKVKKGHALWSAVDCTCGSPGQGTSSR